MVWRRPNAFLSPMEHEAKRKFCATRVKGGNPLRVQGGARESLPSGNSAARRTPNPTKQAERLALYRRRAQAEPNISKTQVLRYSGQGRKSLAGAGRSPRILAVRQSRRQAHSEPNQASQTACALPPPDGCCLCTVFACMRNFPVRCISAAVSGAFFLSGIPRCRKRRGENANPRTNFIFCKKQRIFWQVCAGQGRDNGSNAAKERRKTFGRGTGMERCEPEPKPAKSIYKAKMKDAHHKTVKFIQKIENRAPVIPGARAIV